MKRILLLGGSAQQAVAIETAKKLGYYTILCDYLKDNPGQFVADTFYLVSTTDKDAVLKIATKENIDGIIAYASDPAAPSAAYVAEQLQLPTNPYESVEILCNKDRFRTFLADNAFCTPYAQGFSKLHNVIRNISKFKFPVMIKPVDSSGSKGVSKVEGIDELLDQFTYAMSFSRIKRVIIEEFVDKYGYQIAGDGLAINGKLVFRCFANDHFDQYCVNPFVPISASFPYNMPAEIHAKVHDEIQRLITLLDMKTGTYNFDIRIDKTMNVYLMEIAPRSGGNYIPQVIKYATGVDLIECAVKAAMGETMANISIKNPDGFWSYYAVHSNKSGILKNIRISGDAIESNIVENHIINKPGDEIKTFTGANTTLGILLMKFDSMAQMLDMMDNAEQWIEVLVE